MLKWSDRCPFQWSRAHQEAIKGSGDQLLNKAFSTKSTQIMSWNCHEKPKGTLFSIYKPSMWPSGNRQIHTQNDYRNPFGTYAPKGLIIRTHKHTLSHENQHIIGTTFKFLIMAPSSYIFLYSGISIIQTPPGSYQIVLITQVSSCSSGVASKRAQSRKPYAQLVVLMCIP
jgi:hypothetical protein